MESKKVFIVTGAGRGIGYKIVEELLTQNNIVFALSLTESKNLQNFIENNAEFSINLFTYHFDLTDSKKTKEVVQEIWKKFSRIDVLINCAGKPYGSLFALTSMEEFKRIFDINFFATIYISQICARYMMRKKKGIICNVTSSTALTSDKGTLVYGSSKCALNYATKVLSKELASNGIRVNAVAPGVTNTDMLKKMDEKSINDQLKKSALNKVADPSQISKVILFLCSDSSSHITGQVISVDGGI